MPNPRRKWFPDARIIILLVALLYALMETLWLHQLAPLEHLLQDSWLRQAAQAGSPDPDLVLVNIDERSLAEMAPLVGRWPWPRSVYAQLLDGILPAQPQAVVFDILMSDPDQDDPQGDAWFVKTAVTSPRVFMPMVRLAHADDSQGLRLADFARRLGLIPTPHAKPDARVAMILPFGDLATTGRLGTTNFLVDDDGLGRRYGLYQEVGGWKLPSLPMRLALTFHYTLPEKPDFMLRWHGGKPSLWPSVSFVDLYRDTQRSHPQGLANALKDKLVIIGSTAPQLHDSLPTPLSASDPGVDVLATAIANLKHGDWLRVAPFWQATLLAWLLIGLSAWLLQGKRGLVAAGALLLLLTPALAVAGDLLMRSGWMVAVAVPLACAWFYYVAAGTYEFVRERRARENAIRTFGRFLDTRVVAELIKSEGGLPDTRSRSADITVLFSDIRGFTSLSETRSPQQIIDLLNDYFSRQVEVIFRHGGSIDKFIGDAIMAMWGAPMEDPDHPRRAVAAALEMAEVVEQFRKEQTGDLQQFDIGIGLHSGPAVVGFLGSENKLDYTAIGDTVNLASRIEGQTKGRARILVSDETRHRCGDEFLFTQHDTVQVKGRQQPVTLFEPRRKT
jgi:adenylate cyclase